MAGTGDLDEGFYSRQLYVLGHEAMHRMGTVNVLIAGMRGLGVEIAKNVILSGVKSVTVQDEGQTAWTDLSSQFYLQESHLGQNRATCSVQQLSVLNPHVHVSAHTGPLDEDLLLKFEVVVLTDSSLDDQKRFGELCHSHGIKFIVADTKGLCGQLFCDFGEKFEVLDRDGEMPATIMIERITKENPGLVVCTDDQKHGLSDGCKVIFSEVQGMTELNSIGPVEIKVCGQYSFTICDTSAFSEYERGGVATEVKQPIQLDFKPLSEALQDHQLLIFNDFGKISRHNTLHLAFQALHSFVKKEQRLPQSWSQSDADFLVALVRELNAVAQVDQLDEDAVRRLSYTAQGDLAPMNAFFGGLAAQEVIKACSRKFTPLQQWLYFDALECLPEEGGQLEERSFSSKGTRYDAQIAVFGPAFQEKLGNQKYFLVGAGAIGCELLKNFALIGLGAGEEGHITVTDMDYIERSNLNRQFLFRSQDIGKPKSEIAAKAVREMNPQVKITAHQNRLDSDSEGVYDYNFFMGLDGVAAALDNVEARVYLDGRCVQHQKPLLEGGTLGSKGHTLVVVPHLTESYGPAKSSSSNAIPLCTLKNFPHRIEHTLQWARDQFEGLFKQTPENVNLFLRDPGFVERTLANGDAEAVEILEGVWNSLQDMADGGKHPKIWEDCVSWARCKWETLYNNDICQLLHCFPPGQVTSNGLPFWSGSKRCPHALTFDPNNITHMDYVVAAANLYGHIYGIKGTGDRNSIRETLARVKVPSFTPKSSVKIHTTDEEMEEDRKKKGDDNEKVQLEELKRKLSSLKNSAQMCPIDFEKDDDSNFHIDYIVAASNLRAENYDIPAVDRHQSKRIAGRIIPAIATTTAAVAGLMCLELFKLIQGHKKISSYRTAYLNLAVQYFVLSQPCRPQDFEVAGKKYTLWDDFLVEGRGSNQQEMTLGDLLQHIKEKYDLNICSLFYGPAILYNGHEERLKKSVSDVVKMVTKADIPPHKKMLELIPSFAEDEDCELVPTIRYMLK
ncbi:ubiquitin-like modifier-activating enzyme 1 [Melanotaenia boesemani]|uniref:ubiquitin-like modifier-activating enzyme 1 n=1 Tax=Melanotaenia boesemani TaxID=1250792 RepID=UPI001C05C375|nr:ubiquitin-like modifier-activating enzyme 1 [Melanotaenia boesemani]XP_041836927.1 ubiquitin-like modifier-activating enzyme 1 [Melanotaenia boesemani]